MDIRQTLRSSWVEIDLGAFAFNLESIRKQVGDKEIVAVVKADAYGSGAVRIAQFYRSKGIRMFAVATLAEAVELKEAGFDEEDIIILGLQDEANADVIVENGFIPATDSFEFAEALSKEAEKQGRVAKGIIAFDTGMGRIGFRPDDDYVAEIKKMDSLTAFEYIGMFSHMSNADSADKGYAELQLGRYRDFVETLDAAGIDMKIKSFANSASIVDIPEAYYTHVRPGIILYGHYSMDEVNKKSVPLKNVMTVKAKIVKIKEVDEGECVGYGCRFKAEKKSLIATCNVGYADGFPRAWSKDGRVIIGGEYAPIAGNICMDQFMVDVTELDNVNVGDEVVLMGESGGLEITGEEIASATGTIIHEVLCGFGQRLPKVYIEETKEQ